jgi:hypothetical protein
LWLSEIEDEFATLNHKERGTGKAKPKRDKPENLVEAIDRLEDETRAFKLQNDGSGGQEGDRVGHE